MGKRSPILGYNHNVRYRGLVFHVQTEDSGVATPHLFTHLFHHGVIVSTRKLDYDAGSAEESIKALMQAQHKAVLKDLRRGQFDDKIDSYLGGTPGLLPRGAEEPPDRASEAELAPSRGTVEDAASTVPTEQIPPLAPDEISAPVMIVEKASPPSRAPVIPPARVERRSAGLPAVPSTTLAARGNASAIDTTLRTPVPRFDDAEGDEAPEIEIEVLEHEESGAIRRDTEAQPMIDTGRTASLDAGDQSRPTPGVSLDDPRRAATINDGSSSLRASSPAMSPDPRRLGDRPSTINAATLPAPRPISRPPARTALGPPQVVSRPLAGDDRGRRDSEAVEVYSPAPPSAELPPGERPGQYAQHNRISGRIPIDGLKDSAKSAAVAAATAGVPVPAGLSPPRRAGTAPATGRAPIPAAAVPPPPPPPREGAPRSSGHTEPLRNRVPTPARLPVTRSGSNTGGGVVMTRPAVIVGAPQTKTTGTIPRIRKAREDEGRGFGQGLISEKSLDEVILAYLSEDADEK